MTSPYTASEIISLTNAIRQSSGLEPLHPNPQLTQAATNKAQAMILAKSWSHNTPDATSWQFLEAVGYNYQFAGENLARNFKTAPDVIQAWLESPSHKNNLLNTQYSEIGVAVATDSADSETSVLVVQYLGRPTTTSQTNLENQFNPTTALNFNPSQISLPAIIVVLAITLLIAKIYHRKTKKKPSHRPNSKHWHN